VVASPIYNIPVARSCWSVLKV